MTAWITRWRDTIAAEPSKPGVWRRKEGGFRIRGRTRDPKSNQRREVNVVLADCTDAREAYRDLQERLSAIAADTGTPAASMPHFDDWSATVFERKVASGDILSARGRDKWESILRIHLLPAFGPFLVNKITREDIERWKSRELLAPRVKSKDAKRDRELAGERYSPETCNTILGVLRQVMSEAAAEFNFHDPCSKVDNVSKRGHRTYTYEEPNALKPGDVGRFLDEIRIRYPEHYAFVFLGFITGQRPSSLRPLRRSGPHADVKWEDGKILIRRSHTKRSEVMDMTKTGEDLVLDVDQRVIEVLRWHCDRLDLENERRRARGHVAIADAIGASELLFPAAPTKWNHGGGFRSPSCMDKAFDDVGAILELGYPVSPRCMRRTFQDLARAAKIADVTTRAISGHATPEMQRRYSTVAGAEQRAAMGQLIDFATGERRAA